ncbi:hypothetical protein EDB81DRAFT_201526 [Dactylonectria macrodidyma]|uniref:Uncharacterized protein n=1 Tax=Dactylonectria macrodidyma TaxID=307937 RepID=A0A9P9IKQ4_9HYPO|nr:hypothetical protein EDB81DRAFT_201526 [Dactylonectria macrodidyma]
MTRGCLCHNVRDMSLVLGDKAVRIGNAFSDKSHSRFSLWLQCYYCLLTISTWYEMDCATTLDSSYPYYCGPRDRTLCTIQPDPDIAGIGVLTSFISIGLLVIFLAFIELWRSGQREFQWKHLYQPTGWISHLPLIDRDGQPTSRPSLADVRRYLEQVYQRPHRTSALSATIFSLADTQFVTGIAITAAMSKKDIVLSHFNLADELGWLGYISACVGLLTTRPNILDSSNNAKRLVRLMVMWVHLGLLIHRAREFDASLGYAEKVHENGPLPPYFRWSFESATVGASVFFFIWSIVGAIVDTMFLWPSHALLADFYFATVVAQAHSSAKNKRLRNNKFIATLMRMFWRFVHVILLFLYWIFLEPFSCNLGNLGFFLWGMVSAFECRRIGNNCMTEEDRPRENELGFGQIVALVLLVAPVISTADLWWDSIKETLLENKRYTESFDLNQPLRPWPAGDASSPRSSSEQLSSLQRGLLREEMRRVSATM